MIYDAAKCTQWRPLGTSKAAPGGVLPALGGGKSGLSGELSGFERAACQRSCLLTGADCMRAVHPNVRNPNWILVRVFERRTIGHRRRIERNQVSKSAWLD